MKQEEVKGLIREHMALRKTIESLQEQLRELEDRYEELGELLYGYRSKAFIRAVLQCLGELEAEYDTDIHYNDFFASIINILKNFHEFDADRRNYTPKNLLHLYDEEVEQ
jgi:hypothetical protein